MSITCGGNVQVASMSSFPTQSASSYSTPYARAIQVMLLHYRSATCASIRQAGGADGMFGTGTTTALKSFQSRIGLPVDGV